MYNDYNLQIEMPQEPILPSRSLKEIKNLQKKIQKRKAQTRKDDGYENTYFVLVYLRRQNQALFY